MSANNDPKLEQESRQERITKNFSRIKHRIIVLSGKGGVGKSTTAVNLAAFLADAGRSVGLLDVDIHGPSVPKMLNLERQRIEVTDDERIIPVPYSDNLKVVSIGLLLRSEAEAVIWRGPLKFSLIRQFLADVLWGELDYLIIDSPPGTGDEPLSICQLIPQPLHAIIVTTPQQVAISDVRKAITFCKQIQMSILGIVENMSELVCPACGKQIPLYGAGGGAQLATDTGLSLLAQIPFEPTIPQLTDQGIAFITQDSGKEAATAFRNAAHTIIEQLEKAT